MATEPGRAWPYVIIGLVGAFALMAVAVVVAVSTAGGTPATQAPAVSATAVASPSSADGRIDAITLDLGTP